VVPNFFKLSWLIVENTKGVTIGPGATKFARIPFSASAPAIDLVNATIAPFRGSITQVRYEFQETILEEFGVSNIMIDRCAIEMGKTRFGDIKDGEYISEYILKLFRRQFEER
jgi:hypothetical protein